MPELKNKKKEDLYSILAEGYKIMSSVNLALSEEGLSSDNASLELCEQILAESE